MNIDIGSKIKTLRLSKSMTQEQLAKALHVSAQAVSKWENGKSYPDIHSLLLLSALFDVSLDQLIKGDLETMKQEVNAADVRAMNRDGIIYTILLAATIILPVPLIKWFDLYGLIPELLLWGSAMYFALRLERIKKANNVQSYREILAFSEGRKLDEIEQKVEAGKRPYQKFLLVLLTAGITLLVGMVLSWLLL
jgi:transcriptional regulator with XRE-family HTH domain